MVCQKCGKELKTGAKFCPNCGEKVVLVDSTKQKVASANKAVKVAVKSSTEKAKSTVSAAGTAAARTADSVSQEFSVGGAVSSFTNSVKDNMKTAAQKIEAVGLDSPHPATYSSSSAQTTNTVNGSIPGNLDPKYIPISMWGYFGYEILFSIPIIGLVFLLMYSFGSTTNQNLQNFARSYLCYMIIIVVLYIIFAMIAGGSMYYLLDY